MNNKIMETLENLEDKIENIKWLITPWQLKRSGISEAISVIRRTAGILGSNFPQGTTFENKVRKEWSADIAAATACKNKSILITRNTQHFKNIKEIQIKSS